MPRKSTPPPPIQGFRDRFRSANPFAEESYDDFQRQQEAQDQARRELIFGAPKRALGTTAMLGSMTLPIAGGVAAGFMGDELLGLNAPEEESSNRQVSDEDQQALRAALSEEYGTEAGAAMAAGTVAIPKGFWKQVGSRSKSALRSVKGWASGGGAARTATKPGLLRSLARSRLGKWGMIGGTAAALMSGPQGIRKIGKGISGFGKSLFVDPIEDWVGYARGEKELPSERRARQAGEQALQEAQIRDQDLKDVLSQEEAAQGSKEWQQMLAEIGKAQAGKKLDEKFYRRRTRFDQRIDREMQAEAQQREMEKLQERARLDYLKDAKLDLLKQSAQMTNMGLEMAFKLAAEEGQPELQHTRRLVEILEGALSDK
jgi:hypothetical protein